MPLPPPPSRPSAPRYQTIEAWRGAACLGVLLFHSFGAFTYQAVWPPLEPLRRLCGYGWVGLHLFFVISGYCIFERITAAVARREATRLFWIDRSLRIFPTYWAAIAFTIALNLITWPFNRTHFSGNLPPSLGAFLADLSLTHVLFGLQPFLLVSWTLTCEVAFYLLAGLLLTCSRKSPGLLPAFALGAALCVLAAAVPAAGWSLPLSLWPDFFAGACVSFILRAALARHRVRAAAGVTVLLAISAATFWPVGSYASEARKAALGFAWVLLALYRCDGWLAARAPVRLLSWVGTFSYSLYLTHVQVLTRVMNLGTRAIAPASAGFALLWLLAIGTATLFGWWFWRVVETPSERRRGKWRSLHRPVAAAAPLSDPAVVPG